MLVRSARILRVAQPLGRRALATATQSEASPSPSSSTPTPSEPPKKWTRPVEPGVLPAYDEALAYLERDAELKRSKLEQKRKEKSAGGEAAKSWKKEVNELEVLSEVNMPEVRWNFQQGNIDLSKPVYRHLLDQRWRKMGRLARLMERVYQMHVVPDVVPTIEPDVDVRINFESTSEGVAGVPDIAPAASVSVLPKRLATDLTDVIPGLFLRPNETVKPPRISAQVFHAEEQLYTLVLIDPDVPSPETQSFTSYLHWLEPNISLSATSSKPIPLSPKSLISYVPPHPQKDGEPYHRYVLLLLRQESGPVSLDASSITREGFSVRELLPQIGATLNGGGVFMWREAWDESVSEIYRKILRRPEPVYGKPPKFDPYVDEEGKKPRKYVNEARPEQVRHARFAAAA